ncbi:MAG: hypothetical protein C4314_07520 [Thermoflexus sp.]
MPYPSYKDPLPHERPPEQRIFIEGKPALVLPKGSYIKETDDYAVECARVTGALIELLSPCLGPNALYKLILAEDGSCYLTKDALTIFGKIKLSNPVARILAGAGVDVAKGVGDGSTTTVLLACSIINNTLPLLDLGIKPSELARGCMMAYKRFLSIEDRFTFPVHEPQQHLRGLLRTWLASSTLSSHWDVFVNLMEELISYLKVAQNGNLSRLDNVFMRCLMGRSVAESRLIRGLALMRERVHPSMPTHIRRAKLILIKGELLLSKTGLVPRTAHAVEVNSLHEYMNLLKAKQEVMLPYLRRILDAGVNVILLERGADDEVVEYLARRGVLLLRRFSPQEFDHLASVTGAIPLVSADAFTGDEVVEVEDVRLEVMGGTTWWILEGIRDPRGCEVLLRGPNELFLQEAERLLLRGLRLTKTFLAQPSITYGGGWLEMKVAQELRAYCPCLRGAEQLVVEKIADAFELIPSLLARNSGMKRLDALLSLRSSLNASAFACVDALGRCLGDARSLNIVEPYAVKRRAIIAAMEAAYTLLRVDRLVASRRLSKEESYFVERTTKASPEATKKFYADLGI